MIIGLIGNLGRGKTLGMTFLGHYFLYGTELDHVVSNYSTDITDTYVKNSEDLKEASESREGIYLLDEIWAWMSSRTAMENDTMIDIILNSRKRGCLIIYTVQDLSQVDPILRKNTDLFGVCNHYDKIEVDKDHDVGQIQLIKNNGDLSRNMVYNAELYYGTYDTSEEISTDNESEKYKDYLNDIVEGFNNHSFDSFITGESEPGFESKKEAVSFLELNTDLSNSKKEAIVDEAYRKCKSNGKTGDEKGKGG